MTVPFTGSRWNSAIFGAPGGQVTWTVGSAAGQLFSFDGVIANSEFANAIRSAFETWESFADIDFVEVSGSALSNIKIGWESMDGPSGTLAQASWSSSGNKTNYAEIAFDLLETWRTGGSNGASFFAVALHEIGHAIGLSHADEPNSIMYPYLGSQNSLSSSDILAAQSLYGPSTIQQGSQIPNILGTSANETLHGGTGNDVIFGYAGADSISGYAGNDFIYGDDPGTADYGDNIDGGAGADTIFGFGGNDTIYGGSDGDSISGGAGADSISGNDGNDFIQGGTEGDLINGGAGGDTLSGNEGNDFIYGDDPGTANFGDNIDGGDGADSIFGFGGNDTLWGGAGGDSLRGGEGGDTLRGQGGNDYLYGEGGADAFLYTERGFNVDQIFDFQDGVDKIQMSTGIFANYAAVRAAAMQVNTDVLINAGNGDQIAIKGFDMAHFTADDFMFF